MRCFRLRPYLPICMTIRTSVAGSTPNKECAHTVLGYRDYDYTILRPAENQTLEILAFIPHYVDGMSHSFLCPLRKCF